MIMINYYDDYDLDLVFGDDKVCFTFRTGEDFGFWEYGSVSITHTFLET